MSVHAETDPRLLLLSAEDNVVVAIENLEKGTAVKIEGHDVRLDFEIPRGHKLARREITEGTDIFKYGMPIGYACKPISVGEHVHLTNVRSHYTPFDNVE
ncbi:hypothetical protein E1162_00615 [Rhodobacteraceae bacterium RKSG542]|nr:hypothetical protein [Pseudovibrio flavus]